MASVTSLDKDLRKMRLDKYTPAAAKETKTWIESVLGERLPAADLLDALKDGTALCQLVNLATGPPGVKFKKSAMPFVQMENISQFLRACKSPPLSMHDHDVFLTVDLYEQKDPAQVLQCLGAFSRAACQVNPSAFPSAIGMARTNNIMSPTHTGNTTPTRNRGTSSASNNSSAYGATRAAVGLSPTRTGDSGSGRWSPTKSPTQERVGSPSSPSVSSWSKRNQEGVTSPAWNIAQYGYMGGASQGNLGIIYGTGRRQITSSSPTVPSLAEKERIRREKEAEAEEQRRQMEEQERIRKAELEAEETQARLEEERRWEEESRRAREAEKRKADEEKRRWEEEERQWRLTEEKRRQEEEAAEARLAEERRATRTPPDSTADGYKDRIKQLEEELERARQREAEYEEDRQRRSGRRDRSKSRARSQSRPRLQERTPSRQDSWRTGEREVLQTQWDNYQEEQATLKPNQPARPLPVPTTAPKPQIPAPIKTHRTGEALPTPPIKTHRTGEALPTPPIKTHRTGEALPTPPIKQQPAPPIKPQRIAESRPLPAPGRSHNQTPVGYQPSPLSQSTSRPMPEAPIEAAPVKSNSPFASRTDRYLAQNPAPVQQQPHQTYSRELGFTAEQDAEDRRRAQSQNKTKAGAFAGKSLLEREMEMERERQREWEEAQAETAKAVPHGDGVDGIGGGVGGRWDVGQWSGYTGGDNQNKGGQGIGAGRRQIVGPRPLPGRP